MKPLSAQEIEEAKALCEKATPGPWLFERRVEVDGRGAEKKISALRTIGEYLDFPLVAQPIPLILFQAESWYVYPREADESFIAAARTGWPRALDDLERARELLAELLEVADLRGDSQLPKPDDDPINWTARMQTAWDEARAYLAIAEEEAAP